MNTIIKYLITFVLLAGSAGYSLIFTSQPRLVNEGGRLYAAFEVDAATDIAISVVNPADSTIVRHLAAGVLGANAPAPLARNSLSQKIAWDGLDDMGRAVVNPQNMRVRVRAGMTPRLTNLVGDNPYLFSRQIRGLVAVKNELYVYGAMSCLAFSGLGQPILTMRVFDSTGLYKRTIYPFAPDLSVDSIKKYGIVENTDGSYAPRVSQVYIPQLGNSLITHDATRLIQSSGSGELFFFNGGSFQPVSLSGALKDTVKNTSKGWFGNWGTLFACPAANPRYLYFGGRYEASTSGTQVIEAFGDSLIPGTTRPVTWKDGRIWKLDLITREISPWLKNDSFPRLAAARDSNVGTGITFSAFQGVTVDDSGHVFVADRVRRCIGIYDTNAVFLGRIPLRWPDEIIVDKRTGVIYATSRERNAGTGWVGRISLYKFNGWRNVVGPVCTVAVSNSYHPNAHRTSIAITRVNGIPVVWMGYSTFGVKAYRDMGGRFEPYKDFLIDDAYGFGHITVDRNLETVYFSNNYSNLYKIKDWANPAVILCSTNLKKPLYVADPAVSSDGFLYGRAGVGGWADWAGPVRRFTLDYYHASAPFSPTAKDTLIRNIVTRADAGWADKGIAVSRFGKFAIVNIDHASGSRNRLQLSQYNLSGVQDTSMAVQLVHPLGFQAGGVRYDLQGNVYVGIKTLSSDHFTPIPYTSDVYYPRTTGAVVKYPANQTGFAVDTAGTPWGNGPYKVPGAAKVYAADYGTLSGGDGSCVCRTPRFDVDLYGRIFIPHALSQKVTVLDNEGNTITQFGQYGNIDCRGGLPGPGKTISSPAFPFAWPIGVAASENNMFVSDLINGRIARIRMDYVLDNAPWAGPGVRVEQKGGTVPDIALSCAPNPFNPTTTIRVHSTQYTVHSHPEVKIYDLQGRLVRNLTVYNVLCTMYSYEWNGRAENGKPATSGIYVVRLKLGDYQKTMKIILSK